MSNHLHIVVHMSPATANAWTPDEVAARWVRLYPAHNTELCAQKSAAILENSGVIAEYRSRLTDLSWFMKSLSEPIARKANAEDKVTGRFWEGRFGCQALLSEKSILAAMAYVDLNPVRAKVAGILVSKGGMSWCFALVLCLCALSQYPSSCSLTSICTQNLNLR